MKKILALTILLQACAITVHADDKPPIGEEVFDILLKNSSLPLSKEPMCRQKSATRKKGEITLGEHVATILSVAYQTKNTVSLKSSCALSKFQPKSGVVTDVWDCSLEMKETDAKGDFISSAMLAFYISLDKTTLISGGVRCF